MQQTTVAFGRTVPPLFSVSEYNASRHTSTNSMLLCAQRDLNKRNRARRVRDTGSVLASVRCFHAGYGDTSIETNMVQPVALRRYLRCHSTASKRMVRLQSPVSTVFLCTDCQTPTPKSCQPVQSFFSLFGRQTPTRSVVFLCVIFHSARHTQLHLLRPFVPLHSFCFNQFSIISR